MLVTAVIAATGNLSLGSIEFAGGEYNLMPSLVLLTTSAHFASSTVRLYTKPGAYEEMPTLTLVVPLMALALLTLCIFFADTLGPHLQSLSFTWSPYHYAAQAYGLAVMYSYHSGCALSDGHKSLLRAVCLLPFFLAICQPGDVGLGWVLPAAFFRSPGVGEVLLSLRILLTVLIFAAPLILFGVVWRSRSGPMPVISLLLILTNGVWWATLSYRDAFLWATVFHGVQYLAIVTIFDAKDRAARPGGARVRYLSLRFYAMCVALGYGLFHLLPQAYVFAGFGFVESMLLVVAAINVHHFVVDAYIWRLGKGSNRRIVQEGVSVAI
jgi:hypothetical protein